VELPYVFRPDEYGKVHLINNVKQGINLAMAASNLIRGGFSVEKMNDAKSLIGEASTFFHSLHHRPEPSDENGLADENFMEDWKNEGKDVWMFSGCADDQTSADTSMAGAATGLYTPEMVKLRNFTEVVTGAMSWAFIRTMRSNPQQSYIEVRLPQGWWPMTN
jgi:hypothetical protein